MRLSFRQIPVYLQIDMASLAKSTWNLDTYSRDISMDNSSEPVWEAQEDTCVVNLLSFFSLDAKGHSLASLHNLF